MTIDRDSVKSNGVGGVAQSVRACGSYPQCPGFKSLHRHQLFPVRHLATLSRGTALFYRALGPLSFRVNSHLPTASPYPLINSERARRYFSIRIKSCFFGFLILPKFKLSSISAILTFRARGLCFTRLMNSSYSSPSSLVR